MGSGKTTVGRRLAANLGFEFIDLDQAIEREAGRTIASIFADEGEAAFRTLERHALRRAAAAADVVVAAGGGAVVDPGNRRLMKESGTTVWLNPEFETIVDRLADRPTGERPLFVDPERARDLFESRLSSYQQADLRVDVGADEEAAEVAARIAGLLEGERCAT